VRLSEADVERLNFWCATEGGEPVWLFGTEQCFDTAYGSTNPEQREEVSKSDRQRKRIQTLRGQEEGAFS
jgi:hypothetical protein